LLLFGDILFEKTLRVNFINILCSTFKRADPKSVKVQSRSQYLYALLGSGRVKAAQKIMEKSTPVRTCVTVINVLSKNSQTNDKVKGFDFFFLKISESSFDIRLEDVEAPVTYSVILAKITEYVLIWHSVQIGNFVIIVNVLLPRKITFAIKYFKFKEGV